MYFEHNFMNIDAVILMPDTNQIEMAREKNLTSDNNITLKASFTVETYYPAFRKDRISATGYPTSYGDNIDGDLNTYPIDGGFSNLFSQPPYGNTDGNNFPNRFGPPGYPQPFPPFGPNIGGTEQVVITGTGINTGPVGPVVPGGGTGSGINTGSIGVTGSWYPGGNPAGNGVAQTVVNGQYTSDPDYFMTNPRRTRWFSNILRARERSASGTGNPNAGNPNPSNNGNPSN
jgi:hypothetical protein